MKKDFDTWNNLKKELENKSLEIIIKEAEIWRTYL